MSHGASYSSSSHKPRRHRSNLMPPSATDTVKAQPTSETLSHFSSSAAIIESFSDTYPTSSMDTANYLAYMPISLLGISTNRHQNQNQDHSLCFSYQFNTTNHTSDCPYYSSASYLYQDNTWVGYDGTPFERWLEEDVRDSGAVGLQLGHPRPVHCTCAVIQDLGMDLVNSA